MSMIGKTKKEGVAISLRGVEPTQFIGMNRIVTDPVSDQTGCMAVCNGNDTEVNLEALLPCSDQSSRRENDPRYLQSLRASVMKWNPAANRVLIDSRSMKMILPKDADRG